jgi:predicted transcriptional regulator
MKSADYIKQLRTKTKTGSLYSVAKLLGVSEVAVHGYAKGRREFDTYAALRVAELLNIEPMQVIADVEAARETDEGRKRYWQNLAKKSLGLTATVIFATAILTKPDASHSHSAPKQALGGARSGVSHNINMARIVMRWLRKRTASGRRWLSRAKLLEYSPRLFTAV